jgi:protein TonB
MAMRAMHGGRRVAAAGASAAVHGAALALLWLAQGQAGGLHGAPARLASFALPAAPARPQAVAKPRMRLAAAVKAQQTVVAKVSAVPEVAAAVADPAPARAASPVPPAPILRVDPSPAPPPVRDPAYIRLLWQQVNARKPVGLDLVGRVVVAFALDRAGHLLSAGVEQSSGQVLLDRAALRALRAAAPFPAPPAGWSGGELSFTVELRFDH